MQQSELRYPQMRRELIQTLEILDDSQYQQRVWIDCDYPYDGYVDDLTTTVNILNDLISDDENFNQYVGAFLISTQEAAAVEQAYRAVDAVVTDLGDSPDAQYLTDTRWPDVITKAAAAVNLLKQAT